MTYLNINQLYFLNYNNLLYNVYGDTMKKDNSINTKGLNLSATFIDFYDKLEKINTFYNELLKENMITLEMINKNHLLSKFGQ